MSEPWIPREGHPECKACAITSPAESAFRVCFGEKGCLWRAVAEEAKEKPRRHRRKEKTRREPAKKGQWVRSGRYRTPATSRAFNMR